MEILRSIKVNHLIIIISIFPLSLVAGPFVAEILVFFLLCYFLNKYFKKDFDLIDKNILIFLLLFNCYIIFSSLISDFRIHSLKSSFFYFRFILYSLGIYLVFKNLDKKNIKIFNYIILLTLVFLSFDGIVEFIFGKNLFFMSHNGSIKISGMFGDEEILGSFLVRFLPLVFFIFFNKGIGYKNFILSFFLISITIILSAERSSLILLIVTLFFIFIFFIFNVKKKYWLLPTSLMVISFSLVVIFNEQLLNRYVNLTLDQFSLKFSKISVIKNENLEASKKKNHKETKVIFSNHYLSHYYSSYKMFLDKKLFGHGPNNFRKICNEKKYFFNVISNRDWGKVDKNDEIFEFLDQGSCSTHPHNIYAQFMAELGLFGMIFILIAQFYLFRQLFIALKNNDKNFFLILMMIISLWPLSTSGNFFNNWLSMVYFYPLGIYLYFNSIQE